MIERRPEYTKRVTPFLYIQGATSLLIEGCSVNVFL